MSEPIKVGDLVCVVRDKCCGRRLGLTFVVGEIWDGGKRKGSCFYCGFKPREAIACSDNSPDSLGAPLSWLKRIPPLSELESEKREEKEPA